MSRLATTLATQELDKSGKPSASHEPTRWIGSITDGSDCQTYW